jgi:hypothetical protein
MLHIRMIGALSASKGGVDVLLGKSTDAQVLLAALAFDRGKHVARKTLASNCFRKDPDDDSLAAEKDAERRLRHALSDLKSLLADEDATYLRRDNQTLWLDPNNVAVDLWEIRACCKSGAPLPFYASQCKPILENLNTSDFIDALRTEWESEWPTLIDEYAANRKSNENARARSEAATHPAVPGASVYTDAPLTLEVPDTLPYSGELLASLSQLFEPVKRQNPVPPPLLWNLPVLSYYPEEDRVLWVEDEHGKRLYIPQVLFVDPLIHGDEQDIRVDRKTERFIPDRDWVSAEGFELHCRDARQRGAACTDNTNARVCSWNPETKTLGFQTVGYHAYAMTNMAVDRRTESGVTIRTLLSRGKRLEPIEDSPMGNTLGVNGLIFTSDGYMLLQRRSRRVLVRPFELCSGFSGTIDDVDVEMVKLRGGTLAAMEKVREMVEEVGIQPEDITDRQFLGITRELVRGGAPELFYSVDVRLSKAEVMDLIVARHEGNRYVVELPKGLGMTHVDPTDTLKLEKNFRRVLQLIHSLQVHADANEDGDELDGPISLPLMTNIALWYRYNCTNKVGFSRAPAS